MIQAFASSPSDMRTAGRGICISDDLFDNQVFETRILRIQPDPRLAVEGLPGVDVSAGEIVMKVGRQVAPAMFVDRGHQAAQKRDSSHTRMLLARPEARLPRVAQETPAREVGMRPRQRERAVTLRQPLSDRPHIGF